MNDPKIAFEQYNMLPEDRDALIRIQGGLMSKDRNRRTTKIMNQARCNKFSVEDIKNDKCNGARKIRILLRLKQRLEKTLK